MKKILSAQLGFTIVELMVYMTLLGILLTVLVDIFVSLLKVQTQSEATSSVEEDSRFLLSRLAYDSKQASSISIPASLGASTNNLVLVINGLNYTYSVDNNGNMDLASGTTTDALNSYDTTISGFNVIRQGNPSGKNTIAITFTVTSKAQGSNPEIRTVNTTIGTR